MAVSQPNDYENYDPYGTYQTKGEDPYSLLMKMSSWNKAIRSTISDVKETLDGTIERQSQIIQEVDRIQINVMDIVTAADGVTTRVGQLEVKSDAITLSVTHIDTRVGAAEGKIVVMAGDISLRATIATVNATNARVNTAEINISALQGQIVLKAESTTVNNLGTRIGTAEININGLNSTITQKVSWTDYTGQTIVSMINQTPYYITIDAQHINLIGAVTVLSDITGRLGTITAGTINGVDIYSAYISIYESASIGAGLYLRGGGNYTGIYFGSTQIMQAGNGWLQINSGIESRGSETVFSGSVDFRNANVSGLGGSNTTVRYSAASKRLYIDVNGVQVDYISIP